MPKTQWTKEYDNDTGPNDEGFYEWWEITDGTRVFKCSDEEAANWLLDVLNNLPTS